MNKTKTKNKSKSKSKSKLTQSQKQVINNIIKIETQKRKRRTGRRLTRPKEREQPIRNIDSHASGLLRSAGIQKNKDNTQYEQLKTYLIEQIKKNDEDNYNKAIQNFIGVREEKLIADKHERLSSKPRITNSSFNVRSGDLINDSRISDRGSINNENRINDRGSIENYNRISNNIKLLEDSKKEQEKQIKEGFDIVSNLQQQVQQLQTQPQKIKKTSQKQINALIKAREAKALKKEREREKNQLGNQEPINEQENQFGKTESINKQENQLGNIPSLSFLDEISKGKENLKKTSTQEKTDDYEKESNDFDDDFDDNFKQEDPEEKIKCSVPGCKSKNIKRKNLPAHIQKMHP